MLNTSIMKKKVTNIIDSTINDEFNKILSLSNPEYIVDLMEEFLPDQGDIPLLSVLNFKNRIPEHIYAKDIITELSNKKGRTGDIGVLVPSSMCFLQCFRGGYQPQLQATIADTLQIEKISTATVETFNFINEKEEPCAIVSGLLPVSANQITQVFNKYLHTHSISFAIDRLLPMTNVMGHYAKNIFNFSNRTFLFVAVESMEITVWVALRISLQDEKWRYIPIAYETIPMQNFKKENASQYFFSATKGVLGVAEKMIGCSIPRAAIVVLNYGFENLQDNIDEQIHSIVAMRKFIAEELLHINNHNDINESIKIIKVPYISLYGV